MTRDLRSAALVSVALHGVLVFPGWISQPASVDVQRGPVSFDVELCSEPVARPDIAPQTPVPSADQRQPSLDAAAGHGAFSRAQPHGMQNRPPAYPWLARLQGAEGLVMLRAHVDPDGHPSRVWVARSSGSSILDEAARSAVQHWEFVPAQQDGNAAPSTVEVPVRFRLTASEAENP